MRLAYRRPADALVLLAPLCPGVALAVALVVPPVVLVAAGLAVAVALDLAVVLAGVAVVAVAVVAYDEPLVSHDFFSIIVLVISSYHPNTFKSKIKTL